MPGPIMDCLDSILNFHGHFYDAKYLLSHKQNWYGFCLRITTTIEKSQTNYKNGLGMSKESEYIIIIILYGVKLILSQWKLISF